MEWFIKLHRQLITWEWYDDINVKVVFIHLLLKCNHKAWKWRWVEIQRWETLTWINVLSQEIWLSVQKIRTAIKKLKSTNEITINSTSAFSIIKLNNYNNYQDSNTQDNKQATNEQQASNKALTTNKNDNNKKNEKNEKKVIKHKHWEYKHVLITDTQKEKLIKDFWIDMFDFYIKELDEWIEMKWYKYINHNLAMRKWKTRDEKEWKDVLWIKWKKKVNNAIDTWVAFAPKWF